MTPQILTWIVWGLLCFFTAAWSFGCYYRVSRGEGVSRAIINTVIVWWLLLGWTFYNPHINKLHLLWLAPCVLPLALFLNLLLLLASYIGVLWGLTSW